MARMFLFMSLLIAALFTSNSYADNVWILYEETNYTYSDQYKSATIVFKDQPKPRHTDFCALGRISGSYYEGDSFSGSLRAGSGGCRFDQDQFDFIVPFTNYKYAGCADGTRAQSYADDECKPFDEIQCPENSTPDPITGECNCVDGSQEGDLFQCSTPDDGSGGDGSGGDGSGGDGSGGDGSGGNSNYDCNSSESCLTEAESICAADNRTVMEYQYQGAGYYQYTCGYQEYNCGEGFSWDRANQVCKADQDQDGTPDDQDPEPENPEENGDRDGDGVPDGQDSHPDDPDQWNGNPQSNHNGQNVNPIGESDTFNDSAIVEALNQNTQTTNTTNTKLDSLLEQGSVSNDQLGQINDGLQGLSDALGQEEPTGKGSGDLNDAVGEALDDFEQMTIDEFNQGIDDNLLVEQGDLPTIETAFGGLELEKCEDITNDLFTLELCSLAPRINPILYWAFACFTVIACFQNVSATLKKENR